MIVNDLELKISVQTLSELETVISSLEPAESWIAEIQCDSISEQIKEIKRDIELYESLKKGGFQVKRELLIDELPVYLISARIAGNITQEELARSLGFPESKIKEYEAGYYTGVSLSRAINISKALDLDIKTLRSASGNIIFESDELSQVDWRSFPVNEMLKRGWISDGTQQELFSSVKSFIQDSLGFGLANALHRKSSFGGKDAHDVSLIAWQARVLSSAEASLKSKNFPAFGFNDTWLKDLVQLTRLEEGPILAKSLLAERGIILVYEPHLEGTYLDGAAMLAETGNPVIGMTLRHDRIDNFWFVLFHELGHVFLHLKSMGQVFIDERVGETDEADLEAEADKFALDTLIPPASWETVVARIIPTDKAVIADAQRVGVHPAIVAGRLRRESNNYQLFTELVGYGKVRNLFV